MRTYVYDWRTRRWVWTGQKRLLSIATTVHMAMLPTRAFATTTDDGFANVMNAALNLADWLCVGVIMYAGALWMFDDRTKALERMLGGGLGYIVIRNAPRIRDFLKVVAG